MPDLPAVITVYVHSWVKVTERTGEGERRTVGRRKGGREICFGLRIFFDSLSFKALTDYVYFDSPQVINKSIAS